MQSVFVMASRFLPLVGLLLVSLSVHAQADNVTVDAGISTFHNEDLGITFALNIDQNSEDINFFLSSPPYSWVGVGFGSNMAGSLMLVFYSSEDSRSVTISPRLATGETEPAHYPGVTVTQESSSGMQNGDFRVVGTCKGCRVWSTGRMITNSTTSPFILGFGSPTNTLASNDPTVRLRRHEGYGRFTMNTIQATGIKGVSALAALPLTNASDGAALLGSLQKDEDRQAGAHGIVMTLATLGVAPVDIIAAGALRRWPLLHMITSTALMAFVLGGMGVGIHISRMYLITQKYQTPHQILGLLVIVAMIFVAIMGIYGRLIVRSAARTGNQPPAWSGVLGKGHRWVGRGMWVIMLINVGLGLQFSEANKMLIIGYAVVAAGALILVALIRWTIHCCAKHRREDEEEEDKHAFELSQIYGPGH